VRAIILAAGRGSRMGSMTYNKPKCLVEIQGKPLLEWQLDALRKSGINDIAIVTGYKREALLSYKLKEFYNANWSTTQMVSSLECANEWLKKYQCIVSYSDIFYTSDTVSRLSESDCDLAITYDPNWLDLWSNRFKDPLSDAETFLINRSGYIEEIGNKPKSIQDIQGQYMGLLKFNPEGWNDFSRFFNNLSNNEKANIHMTKVLNKLILKEDYKIFGVESIGKWGEIDSKHDVEVYNK